ncbi:MAG: tetratricopeptide repeat protein [Porticoccaceae bacterium]
MKAALMKATLMKATRTQAALMKAMWMALRSLTLTALLGLSMVTVAAPVVDINDQRRSSQGESPGQFQQGQLQSPALGPQASDEPADMFYQMQILQEEIRQLRGMLEQQSYQLDQLKRQQTENYGDLDGRVSAINAAMTAVPAGSVLRPVSPGSADSSVNIQDSASASPSASPSTNLPLASIDGDRESTQYNAAYALLKARKLDESLLAFQEFVVAFPAGSYTANAYYWMGEIHLVKSRLDAAAAEFSRVVDNYPAHRKALDAHYKLGTVYYQMGDKEKARKHLDTAATGNGSAARLAQRYLEANF